MDKINVQMYSFNGEAQYDTRKYLKQAAEMGYAGVELFGPCFEIPAQEMKTLLDESGLKAISMHAPDSDHIEEMIPYAKTLKMSFIGIGMEMMDDESAVHAFAAKLNRLGEICKKNDLILTYHNHTQEFAKYGEKTVMDILMEETNPEYVSFELDAGWCASAGADPLAFVQKYSGRVKLIHIKESDEILGPVNPVPGKIAHDENGNVVLTAEQIAAFQRKQSINCMAGKGLVDWKALRAIADQHGCQEYIVERELSHHATRAETLKADIDYYKANM